MHHKVYMKNLFNNANLKYFAYIINSTKLSFKVAKVK